MTDDPRLDAIRRAYLALADACGLTGESGTEALFLILDRAVERFDWSIVEESHDDGLCLDVSWPFAEAIVAELADMER